MINLQNSRNSINVVFGVNSSYVQHFTVTATSLIENNKDLLVTIFVIGDRYELNKFEYVKVYFKHKYNVEVHWIHFDKSLLAHFRNNGYYPLAAYYRLFVADLLPPELSSVLYLDCDLIVTGSIRELAETDLNGQYLFAASEPAGHHISRYRKFDVTIESYFNSGVCLINLDLWRRDHITEQ